MPFILGVVGADDGLTGLDVGDTMDVLGVKTLPALGDVTCTVVDVFGRTTVCVIPFTMKPPLAGAGVIITAKRL